MSAANNSTMLLNQSMGSSILMQTLKEHQEKYDSSSTDCIYIE